MPHHNDEQQTSHRHGAVQPHENHETDYHPCRKNHGSHCRLCQGYQGHGKQQRRRQDEATATTHREGSPEPPINYSSIKTNTRHHCKSDRHPDSTEGATKGQPNAKNWDSNYVGDQRQQQPLPTKRHDARIATSSEGGPAAPLGAGFTST